LVVGAIVSIALAYVQSYDEHWSINIYDPNFMAGYFMKYYTKPWYRCPPYLMGMLFAIAWYYFYDPQTSPYAYLKNKKSGETLSLNPENEIIDELQVSLLHNSNTNTTSKGNEEMKYIDSSSFDSEPPVVTTKYRDFIQRNNVYKYSLLVFALFLFAITVLGAQGAYTDLPPDWSDKTMSFYIALSKPAWTLGLCVLSALLFVGELPIISGILANRLTAVLGRLTFCAYLIHPSILFWHYYSEDNPDHFSDIWYALTFLSIVSAVFFLSALVHLAVELPVANLDKLFLGGPAKKPKGKDSSKQQTNHQVDISAQYNVHNSNQPNV
jgi:peptidoglycan/LPS O-acetylase OafA/YrhL